MTATKQEICVKITGYEKIKQGWTGSYTQYRLETQSNLANYDPSHNYVVKRRFNDFKDLNDHLRSVKEYFGQNISQLPPDSTSYYDMVSHSEDFLN